jgi:hypothetical protein
MTNLQLPPIAETVGLLRGALQGMGIFAHSSPDPNRPNLSESYRHLGNAR